MRVRDIFVKRLDVEQSKFDELQKEHDVLLESKNSLKTTHDDLSNTVKTSAALAINLESELDKS